MGFVFLCGWGFFCFFKELLKGEHCFSKEMLLKQKEMFLPMFLEFEC